MLHHDSKFIAEGDLWEAALLRWESSASLFPYLFVYVRFLAIESDRNEYKWGTISQQKQITSRPQFIPAAILPACVGHPAIVYWLPYIVLLGTIFCVSVADTRFNM
jgi:hypothetical protein